MISLIVVIAFRDGVGNIDGKLLYYRKHVDIVVLIVIGIQDPILAEARNGTDASDVVALTEQNFDHATVERRGRISPLASMPYKLPQRILPAPKLLEEGTQIVCIVPSIPVCDHLQVRLDMVASVEVRHYITQYISLVNGNSRWNSRWPKTKERRSTPADANESI
ncbi:hypothetical protein C6Q35_10285 [Burkholderia multivorans]|nr:hypothetical protein C6Q35_10285 [Burkholderia multivorans]